MKIRLTLVIILLLSVIPVGILSAQTTEETKSNTEVEAENKSPSGIEEIVKEKTPTFVKEFITKSVKAIERFRINGGKYFESKRIELKAELFAPTEPKEDEDTGEEPSAFGAPFEKVIEESKDSVFKAPLRFLEFSFITFASTIFNNQTVFYITAFLMLFFLIRALTKQ